VPFWGVSSATKANTMRQWTVLDRYMFKEIALPYGVGLVLFFAVVCFLQLLKMSHSATGLGLGVSDIGQALLFSLPPVLGILLPVCSLFAVLLAVGKMASERELLAAAAMGVPTWRLLKVPLCVGVFSAVCAFMAAAWGEPWGVRGLRELLRRSAQQAIAEGVRAGEFHQWVPGVTFLAQRTSGEYLEQVMFSDRRAGVKPLMVSAKRAKLHKDTSAENMVFYLEEGWIVFQQPQPQNNRVVHFQKGYYRLDVGSLVSNKIYHLSDIQEKSLGTLWRMFHNPHLSDAERARAEITWHRKYAVPLASVVFALLAVAMAYRTHTRSARAQGFLISLVAVVGYYYLGRALELSARAGGYPASLASWTPDAIGLVLFGFFWWRLHRRPV
jgi:LPS export ABC transporter permease LptF